MKSRIVAPLMRGPPAAMVTTVSIITQSAGVTPGLGSHTEQ